MSIIAPHFKVPLGALTVRFKVIPPGKLSEQHDKRRGNGNRNVSNKNEITNNYDYGIGGISSQKIVIGIEQLFHSSNASGCEQG